MTKIELTEKILDAITDPWNECPLDYEDLAPLNLEEATGYLAELRRDEDLADLDPEERVPDEVTPELYMEVFNCHLRAMKHECRVLRLAKHIADNNMVCEYENYYGHADGTPDIFPTDFMCGQTDIESIPFSSDKYDLLDFVRFCRNSSEFDPSSEFCYFDEKREAFFSTDNPFTDGIYNARPFAEFILSPDGHDALDYFVNSLMDEDEIMEVFHCTATEVMDLYSFS